MQGCGRRTTLAMALALCLVAVVAYARPLFFGETFLLRDHISLVLPARTILAAALQEGRIPEWSDAVGLGVPFAGNPLNQVFYPPAWFLGIAKTSWAVDFLIVFHIWLLGWGTARLARAIGADAVGATFGGAAIMLSGYTGSMVTMGVPLAAMAWTPWVASRALALWASTGSARVRHAILAAMVLCLQILAGDPACVITTVLLAAAFCLCVRMGARQRLLGLVALGGACLLALLLAAVLVLPAVAVLLGSTRQGGIALDEAQIWSMHPWRMLEWFWPGVLGNPVEAAQHTARLFAHSAQGTLLEPSWALSLYLGMPVLVLALVGAFARPGVEESRLAGVRVDLRWLAVAALFYVLLALGRYTPIYAAYRWLVLPERLVRYPERHVVGALILCTALAGVGFTKVMGKGGRVAWASALAMLAPGVGIVGLFLFRERAIAWISRAAVSLAPPLDAAGACDYALAEGASALWVSLLFIAMLLLAARRRFSRRAGPLAATVLVGHLLGHSWALLPVVDRGLLARPPEILAPVLPEPVPGGVRPRVYRAPSFRVPAGLSPLQFAVVFHETAGTNTALRFGFADLPGYDPSHSARYVHVWNAVKDRVAVERVLDLWDARYAVVPAEAADAVGLPVVVMTDKRYALVENERRRSRAFVAGRWQWLPGDEEVEEVLFAREGVDLSALRLAGQGEASVTPGPASACELTVPFPERLELSCTSQGGYAAVIDAWAPGWTATVDETPVPVERADVLIKAVRVGPGTHRVVFSYRTPGLRVGAAISLLAWLAAAAALGVTRARFARPRTDGGAA